MISVTACIYIWNTLVQIQRAMATMTHESLRIEWERISPSEPMPHELQILLLMYTNAARPAENPRPRLISVSAPPPQRFRRPATARTSRDTAPPGPGPSKVLDLPRSKSSTLSGASFDLLPQGPEEGWHLPNELDVTFEALNTKLNVK